MKKLLGIIWLSIMVSAVFGLVGYGESNVFSIRDQHVPVQLSSFEAVATAQGNVAVAWVTQSENGLIGFRVYRSELETQATAQLITPTIIPATNTSTLQRYSYSDLEVTVNKCYYYWLESVEYNTSEYFGPVSVTIEDNSVPSFPNRTYLSRAYPNPFHISSSAKIDLSVKTRRLPVYPSTILPVNWFRHVKLTRDTHHNMGRKRQEQSTLQQWDLSGETEIGQLYRNQ